MLDGEATETWHESRDEGRSGIFVQGNQGHEIIGVQVRNFNGAGVHILSTVRFEEDSPGGGVIENMANLALITAVYNYVGVHFDERAEYMNATQLHCQQNVIGCIIQAGNVKIYNSSFVTNIDGMKLEDKTNVSHGHISN